MIAAYILMTYGPKPKGVVNNHVAARQQFQNLKDFAKGAENLVFSYDYSRRFNCLEHLPELKRLLKLAKEKGFTLIIDDFRRLFAHSHEVNKSELLKEFLIYGEHFLDLRTKRHIGKLTQSQLLIICASEPPIKFVCAPTHRKPRSLDARQDQTFKATVVSRMVRRKAADAKALELQELGDRLLETSDGFTYKALADAANQEGLTTTRKGKWTGASVSRALKRLEAV